MLIGDPDIRMIVMSRRLLSRCWLPPLLRLRGSLWRRMIQADPVDPFVPDSVPRDLAEMGQKRKPAWVR